MSQEWDIDDILASLDELLEEGKADDTSEKKKSSSIHMASQMVRQSSPKDPVIKADHAIEKKPSPVTLEDKVQPSTPIVKKIKLQPPKRLDIDVPDANFRQEPHVDGHDETPILPRVILTQDMMVEKQNQVSDAFSPLLDAMDDDDIELEKPSKPIVQKDSQQMQGVHLNAKQIEQVLELVSMDVSYQFNQLLPDIIRTSLQTHLQMLQNEPLEK